MKSKNRTLFTYSTTFKLEVISQVLDGTYTKEQAAQVYRIGGKSAILEWMRKLSKYQVNKNHFSFLINNLTPPIQTPPTFSASRLVFAFLLWLCAKP